MAPTREVPVAALGSARALMDVAFDDGFTEHDWAHALGGLHAWVEEDGAVVAHGAVVPRRLWVGPDAWHAGYVEAVAVRPDRRRQGLGGAVMAALEQRAPAYDLLALGSSAAGLPFYVSRGWVAWRGATGVRGPTGDRATPDEDGSVLVLVGRRGRGTVDLDSALWCEPRTGDDW